MHALGCQRDVDLVRLGLAVLASAVLGMQISPKQFGARRWNGVEISAVDGDALPLSRSALVPLLGPAAQPDVPQRQGL